MAQATSAWLCVVITISKEGLAFAEYSLDTRLYSSELINHFKVID